MAGYEADSGHEQGELPIFELPAVLLPGELMPLHIFEDRYKRMIVRCLDEGEPFGIVFRDEELGARNVGCEARVTGSAYLPCSGNRRAGLHIRAQAAAVARADSTARISASGRQSAKKSAIVSSDAACRCDMRAGAATASRATTTG